MTLKVGRLTLLFCAGVGGASWIPARGDDRPRPSGVEAAAVDVALTTHLPSPEAFARPDSGPSTCSAQSVTAGASVGPDLVVGHVFGCAKLGHEGPIGSGTIGMSCWTTACTKGDMGTNWFGLPSIDHPMINVNLYRLSTQDGSDRLMQLGRSWIKHGFGTENADDCGFGCTPGHFNLNGPGCSDTYAASQFLECDLGPKSMIHPYTGVMPTGPDLGLSPGCSPFSRETVSRPANDHRDHVHNQISHRLQILDVDLDPVLNPGAVHFAEGQYIVPHEFVAGNGTQNNNVSHRRVLLNGPDSCGNLEFLDLGGTFSESPAIDAWTGASQTLIEPAALVDGRGFLVHKVTPLGGMWRYEYALYNMNMDASFGSLSIPLPAGAVVSNVGSHFPLNHAPEPHTENYSNTPWTVSTSGGAVTWSTSSFGVDPFANAVRWGTMYNFYFDANTPPTGVSAAVGLFKTGGTAMAAAQGPSAGPVDCNANTIEDRCDVSCALPDCAVPGCGTKPDCDGNFVPDSCEPDCNGNTIADRCDITSAFSADCDANAIPDECEPFIDCNGNLIRDACETYNNPAGDLNDDGIPDECVPPLSHVWFVDDNGPGDPVPGWTGASDPLENGSMAHPYDAMQEAIVAAAPGDLIVVRDGLYSGFGNSFLNLLSKPVTLRSENGPAFTTVDLEFFAMFIDMNRGGPASLRIEGFHVINLDVGGGNTLPAVECGVAASPTFHNCVFTVSGANNGSTGFRLFQGSRAVISHCRFQNVRTAVETFNGRPTIDNTVIHGAGNGVVVNGGDGTTGCLTSSSARIVNSTISNCLTGLSVPGGNFADVENSVLWGNTTQISVPNPASVTVSHSNVQGGWAGPGNIDANPSFVNAVAGDYRLTAGSPCIDAGDGSVADLSATDHEGGTRSFDDPTTIDTGSGSPPIVDMGADEWTDCNANGIDDSIDIDTAFSADCNRNRVPDSCEALVDCNGNLTQDSCEVTTGPAEDCNLNIIPDECDTALGGGSADCNTNTIPDECEVDCQRNGVPDDCDTTLATSVDCNGNGVPDECEADCQPNGTADACDIANLTSQDVNSNQIPDECEAVPAPSVVWDSDPSSTVRGTRSLSVSLAAAAASGGPGTAALRLLLVDLQNPSPANPPCCPPPNFSAYESATCTALNEGNGCARWVGPAVTIREAQDNVALGTFVAARLQCTPYYTDWTTLGSIKIVGPEILPSSTLELTAYGSSCKGVEGSCTNLSTPVQALTRRSGDVASPYAPSGTQPDPQDVVAVLNKFKNQPGAPGKAIAQVQPNVIELNVDVGALDIVATIDAFRGVAYPFSGPCPCPSTVTCGATACGTCAGGGLCVKTCSDGTNAGQPCLNNNHCPGGTCGSGFCRDRCGRCSP